MCIHLFCCRTKAKKNVCFLHNSQFFIKFLMCFAAAHNFFVDYFFIRFRYLSLRENAWDFQNLIRKLNTQYSAIATHKYTHIMCIEKLSFFFLHWNNGRAPYTRFLFERITACPNIFASNSWNFAVDFCFSFSRSVLPLLIEILFIHHIAF